MDRLDLQTLERLVFISAALVVVIVIVLVVYIVVARRQEKERQARLYDLDDVVVRPSFLVAGQVLSLVRDEPGEPLQVEIEGAQYRKLVEVQDPKIKRQIVDAALELIQFTGVLGTEDLQLVPLPSTETWREDMREGSESDLELARSAAESYSAPTIDRDQPKPPPAPPEVEGQFLSMLAKMGQPPPEPSKPSLMDSIQHSLQPKPMASGQPRTVVDDIEDIIQRRIQLIPALVGRGLHVRSGPGVKVLFTFEGQEYQSVGDIPNLTARQLIKDAIQEWDETT
jgi:hypothetical protein